MYDIRQFRPALYVLLVLGLTGFALSSQSPGLWVFSVGAIAVNAWLVHSNRFRPMPRLIANIVTIGGLMLLGLAVRQGVTAPILIIGQFLVLLQLVKIYEQRANRDYAQLLVLSLLLMVAAAISTASLVFGLLFIAYLFLSLYCCLLFHLKVETDHAKQAIGIPEDKLNPATLRQDQRYLSRSMRRLTALTSFFAVTTAVATFLFFPRGSGAGLFSPLQWKPSQTLTGFSDTVSFQHVASIQQNTQKVAWVKVMREGKPYRFPGPLMLRGVTLDRYSGQAVGGGSPFQWTRTARETVDTDAFRAADWNSLLTREPGAGDIEQHIILEPTGTNVLFAVKGITHFKPEEGASFRYSREDEVLQTTSPLHQTLSYSVRSRDRLTADPFPGRFVVSNPFRSDVEALRRDRPPIDRRIEDFARLPEVSGTNQAGPLAAQRRKESRVSPLDLTIAQNIERYLQTSFSYTLDLTDFLRIDGEDPVVAFLYTLKRGHCEYFAGAMTLMCQSLGMQARMVVGFKCDEYNTIGDYYEVRQLHAHAWVEVLTADGTWVTFDPTSGRDAPTHRADTVMQRLRSLFSYLEYTWANSVVAYDRESRSSLISAVDRQLQNTAVQSSDAIDKTKAWFGDNTYVLGSKVISGMIAVMIAMLFAAVGWFAIEKWRLRRRARRIGLGLLPATEQMKLARQLGFYDDLLRLLERHRIYRPAQLTPMEFSSSLTFLPVEAFHAIRRLTEIFYRVRYGRAELSSEQRRHLTNVIAGVGASLDTRS